MELSSAVPIAAVLAAGLIAWITERGREKRDMRRAAYVEWLKAARLLASWPVNKPESQRLR